METDGLVLLIVLPIRELMLGLILLLEFVLSEDEVLLRVLVVDLFVVVVRVLLLDWLLLLLSEVERLLDGVLVLIELPIRDVMLELMRLLELGAVDRELIDLLEVLLLGVRLVIALLELRLDETLLERLDDDDLDVDLGAGAGLETCRLCLLELLDLLLLDRVLAAKTGSENNKRANRMQETTKSGPSRRDSTTLTFDI